MNSEKAETMQGVEQNKWTRRNTLETTEIASMKEEHDAIEEEKERGLTF